MTVKPLQTGQRHCYDANGAVIPCQGTGQDGELRAGLAWPKPRFEPRAHAVYDRLTGLTWLRNANLFEWPMTWAEAFDRLGELNPPGTPAADSWRLPNRRELRSLMSFATRNPALPENHPFENWWLGWYWTSTTAAINAAYAWYVHLEGARMFYGHKNEDHFIWPVRGQSTVLAQTGQRRGFDCHGQPSNFPAGQDGIEQAGLAWPSPRFSNHGDVVLDRLTELVWTRSADLQPGLTDWQGALDRVANLNRRQYCGIGQWRLPNINELESLVDASAHHPALPSGHPFDGVGQEYWSSTTSSFEPDWAMALYLQKGVVGVGPKTASEFLVWAVSGEEPRSMP